MGNKKRRSKKPVLLYIIIILLTAALISLGILTYDTTTRLTACRQRITELEESLQNLSDSAASLAQKAQELENSENEQTTVPSEESTENKTDESLNSLLSQISTLLPQNNGTWSVYVCNLQNNTEGTVSVQPMQAASLIKLFIMGAVYENYDQLAEQYGNEALDANLSSMITVSDNDASNTLVNWLGGGDNTAGIQVVNSFCQSHGYTSTSMGRMLLASNENGDNYTSVQDCGRFLKAIYQTCNGTAEEVSLSHTEDMYGLLKLQTRTNKIPAQMPEGVHVANKTGELSNVENDAGIIFDTANGIDLIICFMSQNLSDTAAAQASIAENSRRIYGYYNE